MSKDRRAAALLSWGKFASAQSGDIFRALQALHPGAIAFENLDPLLGRRVHLDLLSVQQKLIGNLRGGYCFEHNGLFAAALEALGFKCSTLAARVVYGRTISTRRSHM